MISKLHYISQQVLDFQHVEMIHRALTAGVKWVQLRIKNEDQSSFLEQAAETGKLCRKFGATFIVNDRPDIAMLSGANGVHLGKDDMSVAEAREILGPDAIIGGTCNTYKDVIKRLSEGVDYIGLGPFRYTVSKENLSPVLGLEGYQSIISNLTEEQRKTPIIAIGGIKHDDIKPLIELGVYGVAIASLINFSGEPEREIKKIKSKLGL